MKTVEQRAEETRELLAAASDALARYLWNCEHAPRRVFLSSEAWVRASRANDGTAALVSSFNGEPSKFLGVPAFHAPRLPGVALAFYA